MTLDNFVSRHDDERVAREILGRARSLIEPTMHAVISRVSPVLQPVLAHHFAGGGKNVRAGLAILSAAAAGVDESVGIDGAVSIELIHNFSLIHDDIIDHDHERRHRPTAWVSFGVGPAIIAGDSLSTLAFQLLLETPTVERVRAARRLASATQAMIEGQADDIAFEAARPPTVEQCLKMVAGKTGALLACASAIGAELGGASESVVEALSDFGLNLGIAFQAIDDILGIWGEPEVTGKPRGSDLRRRKKTLPVSLASARGIDVLGAFHDSSNGELSEEDVATATSSLEECGARKETFEIGERYLRTALEALERAPIDGEARADLAVIARYIVGRDQ